MLHQVVHLAFALQLWFFHHHCCSEGSVESQSMPESMLYCFLHHGAGDQTDFGCYLTCLHIHKPEKATVRSHGRWATEWVHFGEKNTLWIILLSFTNWQSFTMFMLSMSRENKNWFMVIEDIVLAPSWLLIKTRMKDFVKTVKVWMYRRFPAPKTL